MSLGDVATVAINVCDELRFGAPRHAEGGAGIMGRQDRNSQLAGFCALLDLVLVEHSPKRGGTDILES